MVDFVQTKLPAKVKLEANNLSGKTSRTLFAVVIYYNRYNTNHVAHALLLASRPMSFKMEIEPEKKKRILAFVANQ